MQDYTDQLQRRNGRSTVTEFVDQVFDDGVWRYDQDCPQ